MRAVAALLGALLLAGLFTLHPQARGGGGTPVPCTASAPAQASAVGFTALQACDDFSTLHSIDVANTQNAAFHWFPNASFYECPPQSSFYCGVTPPSALTNDGTGVAMATDPASGIFADLLSAVRNGAAPGGYVGRAWAGGFYAEVAMKFDKSQSNVSYNLGQPGAQGYPAFRFWSVKNFTQSPFTGLEIDVFEQAPTGAGTTQRYTNIYDWNGGGMVGAGTVDSTANAPDTAYHKYGVLWMPAAQNAGSGYWKFYYDDTLYMTVGYSGAGAPSLTTTAATSVCYYSTSFANEAWPGTHCTASGMFSDADGDTEIALLGKGYVGFSNTYQYFHLWKAP